MPTTSNVVVALRTALENHKEKYPNFQKKYGGFLCIMDRKKGKIIKTVLIGAVPAGKAARYESLAKEKAKRLFSHLNEGHLTSYESRDPEADKWGGAILTENLILSFSGFPEDGDSFICLSTAHTLRDIKKEDEKRIIVITKTEYLAKLPEIKKLLQ